MRYQAKIENGIVIDAIVVDDNFINTLDGVWVEYSEEDRVGIGYTYNEVEGFRPPKPFPSWIWNGSYWDSPVPLPDEVNIYEWNEDTLTWVMIYMRVV